MSKTSPLVVFVLVAVVLAIAVAGAGQSYQDIGNESNTTDAPEQAKDMAQILSLFYEIAPVLAFALMAFAVYAWVS